MADDVWGRARIPTGESVAAALRLAKELRAEDCLLWDGDHGATELLARAGGTVFHHVTYESGATERVEVRAATQRFRLGQWMVHCGFLGMPLVMGAAFLFKPEHSVLLIGVPFMLALGLVWASMLVQKRPDLDALAPRGVASARIPHDLGGWQPRTASQLAAVLELCEAGDGYAYLLEQSGGGVEVETSHKHQRRRHLLDVRGSVLEQDVVPWSTGAVWAARVAALVWVIPFLALLYADGWRYFLAGAGICFLVGAAASRFQPRRPRSLPGEPRFTVQLEAPSD